MWTRASLSVCMLSPMSLGERKRARVLASPSQRDCYSQSLWISQYLYCYTTLTSSAPMTFHNVGLTTVRAVVKHTQIPPSLYLLFSMFFTSFYSLPAHPVGFQNARDQLTPFLCSHQCSMYPGWEGARESTCFSLPRNCRSQSLWISQYLYFNTIILIA
jgi:hypothetical protein